MSANPQRSDCDELASETNTWKSIEQFDLLLFWDADCNLIGNKHNTLRVSAVCADGWWLA